jgi:hypothetical protein
MAEPDSSREELLKPLLEVHILAMPAPVAIAALAQRKTNDLTGRFSAPC